jgi:hypothetical protein
MFGSTTEAAAQVRHLVSAVRDVLLYPRSPLFEMFGFTAEAAAQVRHLVLQIKRVLRTQTDVHHKH